MSTTENEQQQEEEKDEGLLPAADLDDLFKDEEDSFEIEDVEIPEDLSDDELRARLVRAEKKAKFEEQQRLAVSRKGWASEAKEHFPYSSPEEITASSRRAFLEEAKAQDTKFRTKAETILSKGKTEDELRAEIREELEKEAAAAFGRPYTQSGGSTTGVKEEDTNKAIDKSRKKRDLHGSVKAMMDGGRF